jgi:hypothetical protein
LKLNRKLSIFFKKDVQGLNAASIITQNLCGF